MTLEAVSASICIECCEIAGRRRLGPLHSIVGLAYVRRAAARDTIYYSSRHNLARKRRLLGVVLSRQRDGAQVTRRFVARL